ncbi:SRPBCC family protein [Nocardia sp. IBHARD005]|uniref:SRPBCC family protein n=1 Tax=Nocardia sp. IBHARD005 TaxID=3457765 RepID=UPI004058F51A
MTEDKPFQIETTIEAPLDTVWQALTETDRIRDWFGWDYAGLDDEIRYIFVDHAEQLPGHRIVLDGGQEIQVSVDGPRCVVRVVRPGELSDARWADIYDGIEEGWRTFLEQLRFRLERAPAESRRTIYLTGTADPAAIRDSVQTSGAEVWHSSRYQHIAIDTVGHLVAVGAPQPLDTDGTGPTCVTVSAYGLDDAAFAHLRQRWADRWAVLAQSAEVTS